MPTNTWRNPYTKKFNTNVRLKAIEDVMVRMMNINWTMNSTS